MGHKRKTANYSIFEDTAKTLELSPQDLSETIGYSRSAWNAWQIAGRIPASAALGCECLRRRANAAPTETQLEHDVALLTIERKHIETVRAVITSMGGEIKMLPVVWRGNGECE